jgi:hypothetical protein
MPKIVNPDPVFRDGPFNFQGGVMVFFSKKLFWFPMLLKKIFWFWWRKKKSDSVKMWKLSSATLQFKNCSDSVVFFIIIIFFHFIFFGFFFVRELEYFFSQNLTLGYMTKTPNQIFFSSTKIRIFFSATLGIRIIF